MLFVGCGEQQLQTPQLPRTVIFFHETKTLSEVPFVALPPHQCQLFESSADGIKIVEVRDEENDVEYEHMPHLMLMGEPSYGQFPFATGGYIYHVASSAHYKKAPGNWSGIFTVDEDDEDNEHDAFENVYFASLLRTLISIRYRLRYRKDGKVSLGPEMILKSYAVD